MPSTISPQSFAQDCTNSINEALKHVKSGKPISCPPVKCPICKCETNEADSHAKKDPIAIHKDTEFDISKLPKPEVIPEDNADSFVIDVGTYIPAENHLYTNAVRRRPEKPCDEKTKVIIGIKTVPMGKDRRTAIRETWGNLDHFKNYPAQVVFLLGMESHSAKQNAEFKRLETNDDLIVGDFVDSFHNLTYKDSMFLTWVKHECPGALYVRV